MLTLVETPDDDTGTYYVLNEQLEPVEGSKEEWQAFQTSDAATVAVTNLGGLATVVTTFTGLDDGFGDPNEPPYVFETMGTIRGEADDLEAHRTWAEAEEGHRSRVQEMLRRFRLEARADEPELAL